MMPSPSRLLSLPARRTAARTHNNFQQTAASGGSVRNSSCLVSSSRRDLLRCGGGQRFSSSSSSKSHSAIHRTNQQLFVRYFSSSSSESSNAHSTSSTRSNVSDMATATPTSSSSSSSSSTSNVNAHNNVVSPSIRNGADLLAAAAQEADRLAQLAAAAQSQLLGSVQQQQEEGEIVQDKEIQSDIKHQRLLYKLQDVALEVSAALLIASGPCTLSTLQDASLSSASSAQTATTALHNDVSRLHRSFVRIASFCVAVLLEDKNQTQPQLKKKNVLLLQQVMELARRANELSLPFHLPLYQLLATAVAEHAGQDDDADDEGLGLAESILDVAALAAAQLDPSSSSSSSTTTRDSKLLAPALLVLVLKRQRLDVLARILLQLQSRNNMHPEDDDDDDERPNDDIDDDALIAAELFLSIRNLLIQQRMKLNDNKYAGDNDDADSNSSSFSFREADVLQCVKLLEPGVIQFLQQQQEQEQTATEDHVIQAMQQLDPTTAHEVYSFLATMADPRSSDDDDDDDDNEDEDDDDELEPSHPQGDLHFSNGRQRVVVNPIALTADSILAKGMVSEHKHQILLELVRRASTTSTTRNDRSRALLNNQHYPLSTLAAFLMEEEDSGDESDNDDEEEEDEDNDDWSIHTIPSPTSASSICQLRENVMYMRGTGDADDGDQDGDDDDIAMYMYPDVTEQLIRLNHGRKLFFTRRYEEYLWARDYQD